MKRIKNCANCFYSKAMPHADTVMWCEYRSWGDTEKDRTWVTSNNRCRLWVKKYKKREAKK